MFKVKGNKLLKLVHHSLRVEVKISPSGQFLIIEDSETDLFMHWDVQISLLSQLIMRDRKLVTIIFLIVWLVKVSTLRFPN